MSAWIIVYIGPDTHRITFVASRFAVVSFLCTFDAASKNNSGFRGENKQYTVILCALRVYSLRFWKDNH